MNDEGLSMDELRARWNVKHERIKKENKKCFLGLGIQVLITIPALILNLLHIIDLSFFLVLLIGAMFISLVINQWVYFRVQKIIWSDVQ